MYLYRAILFRLTVLLLCLISRQANADHFKLFLLTGQSNSLGTTAGGEADTGPGWDPADQRVRFFWCNVADADKPIGDSDGKWTTLKVQQGGHYPNNANHWGPEFGFARQLVRAGAGPLGIIKVSRGGGGNTNWSKSENGHMYQQLLETVSQATSRLKQQRHTFEIAGLLYLQGESDRPVEAEAAGQRLLSLLQNLRQDLPNADQMRMVVGGIAAAGETRDLVRSQQLALAKQQDSIGYFDNQDLQNQLYDRLHFDRAAKLTVGQRFASEFIRLGVVQPDFGKLVFIGDSITQGSQREPSYRYQVFRHLVDVDATFQFVGSVKGALESADVSKLTPDHRDQKFDNIHDGHWGWRASWIAGRIPLPADRRTKNRGEGNLKNWLGLESTYLLDRAGNRVRYPDRSNSATGSEGATYQPDAAIIMVGINDVADGVPVDQIRDDLRTMVKLLQQANDKVRVFLAQTLSTDQSRERNAKVDQLNQLIPALAREMTNQKSLVTWINTNAGFDPKQMTLDQIHPNQVGAAFVGRKIASGLGLIPGVGFDLVPDDGNAQEPGLGKPVQTSFESAPAGPVDNCETEVGTWNAQPGHAVISKTHHRTGNQCLHLLGGENRQVELELAPTDPPRELLSFWAERWTVRNPFSFQIEALINQQWQSIYDGNKSVVVGRSFKSHVNVWVPPTATRLRFRSTSPADTGVLIDDLELKPSVDQDIVAVTMQPFVLPALIRNDRVAIGKLHIECDGTKNPLSIDSAIIKLRSSDAPENVIRQVALATTGTEPHFNASEPPQLLTSWVDVTEQSLSLEFKTSHQLADGSNYVWVVARLEADATIDNTVAADFSELMIDGNAIEPANVGNTPDQRLGVAVRKGGDDQVHTYRIPGLATTRRGSLIAVYDIRHRNGGDLPGDIDVGMSRSIDGGQTWQPMQTIMDMGRDSKWQFDGVGDPSILVDQQTGTIWVAALWSHGNRAWNGSGPGMTPEETGQLVLVRSDDDGQTWSEPINITSQVKQRDWCLLLQGPGKGITMQDGTLVFPAQFQDTVEQKRLPRSTIIYSRDHGKTWQAGTGAWDDTTEAQVVELEPGKLMLNCRYNRANSRVVMTTVDMGQTWQRHPTSIGALIEPRSCQASLIKIEPTDSNGAANDAGLLLFSNPNSTSGRNHLTIKASLDQGNSWPEEYQVLLDQGGSAGYSCLTMVDKETVGILYEGSQAHMTFQRIKLKDILSSDSGSDQDSSTGQDSRQADQGKSFQLGTPFSDQMVVQADMPIRIWGTGQAGAFVTVKFGDDQAKADIGNDRSWFVELPAQSASSQPRNMELTCLDQNIVLRDVVVGEVWFCAGQSNMEFPLKSSRSANEALAAANDPAIRLFDFQGIARGGTGAFSPSQIAQLQPDQFASGSWRSSTVESAAEFSAVAYYFGTRLRAELNCPVGLINVSSGGTPIESWLSLETIQKSPELKSLANRPWLDNPKLEPWCRDRAKLNLSRAQQQGIQLPGDSCGPYHPFKPGFMYSSSVKPFLRLPIRGVLWYQGESNAESRTQAASYPAKFLALIKSWRASFDQPQLPFLFVQLPALNRPHWPAFREYQRRMLDQIEHVGMAISLDCGDANNVHPNTKRPVGNRLARLALAQVYGKQLIPSGPMLRNAQFKADKAIAKFDFAGNGLKSNASTLAGFELAGSDGIFQPGTAKIVSADSVEVSSDRIAEVRQLRYAWAPDPGTNASLQNSDDLPASPFTTSNKF